MSIANLDVCFAIAGYARAARVCEDTAHDFRMMQELRPAAVFVDMQPTAVLAARALGLPVISTGDSDFFRETQNSWMPWIPEGEVRNPYPSCLPAFGEAYRQYSLRPPRTISETLRGDVTLIASAAELERSQPPLPSWEAIKYMGLVAWEPPWSTATEELAEWNAPAGKRVFITLGHGGKNTEGQLQSVIDGSLDAGAHVFLSTGFRGETGSQNSDRLRVGEFVGIRAGTDWADLVIAHGGYSTVLNCLRSGKASIHLPFMSEQEANARIFVEDNGAGLLARRTSLDSTTRHFVQSDLFPELPVEDEDPRVRWAAGVDHALSLKSLQLSARRLAGYLQAAECDFTFEAQIEEAVARNDRG
ncbi:glycosyltransferase [Nocardioides sp. SYSU D00038]|uniref:glycosyltransferase n=1 Tax=Nocardioides sp. SYSU D00038 TaxID=2812554 RepID=UPI00196853DC|nr:glycosyltransferase [Nocardioides sp. SYSU D00038]